MTKVPVSNVERRAEDAHKSINVMVSIGRRARQLKVAQSKAKAEAKKSGQPYKKRLPPINLIALERNVSPSTISKAVSVAKAFAKRDIDAILLRCQQVHVVPCLAWFYIWARIPTELRGSWIEQTIVNEWTIAVLDDRVRQAFPKRGHAAKKHRPPLSPGHAQRMCAEMASILESVTEFAQGKAPRKNVLKAIESDRRTILKAIDRLQGVFE